MLLYKARVQVSKHVAGGANIRWVESRVCCRWNLQTGGWCQQLVVGLYIHAKWTKTGMCLLEYSRLHTKINFLNPEQRIRKKQEQCKCNNNEVLKQKRVKSLYGLIIDLHILRQARFHKHMSNRYKGIVCLFLYMSTCQAMLK